MAETRSRSLRVEDGLWGRFCALPGSQNDAFRRLLDGEVDGLAQKIYERAGRIENMVEELLGLGFSVKAPKVASDGLVDIENSVQREHGFPMNCRHCRESKKGPTKFASICFDCKAGGHSNDPSECPVCTDYGTGAL